MEEKSLSFRARVIEDMDRYLPEATNYFIQGNYPYLDSEDDIEESVYEYADQAYLTGKEELEFLNSNWALVDCKIKELGRDFDSLSSTIMELNSEMIEEELFGNKNKINKYVVMMKLSSSESLEKNKNSYLAKLLLFKSDLDYTEIEMLVEGTLKNHMWKDKSLEDDYECIVNDILGINEEEEEEEEEE